MKKVKMVTRMLVFMFFAAIISVPVVYGEEAPPEPTAPEMVPAPTSEAAPAPATEAAPEMMQSEPALTIERMVIAENIVDKEPVGAAETFPASIDKVYCFIEAKDIKEDTTLSFVWYFQGNQMAKVDMNIHKGDRWRTYSSKRLGGLKGEWKVEIQDQNEVILKIAEFQVE